MIKNTNTSVDLNEMESLMVELESRPEFICCGNGCGANGSITACHVNI